VQVTVARHPAYILARIVESSGGYLTLAIDGKAQCDQCHGTGFVRQDQKIVAICRACERRDKQTPSRQAADRVYAVEDIGFALAGLTGGRIDLMYYKYGMGTDKDLRRLIGHAYSSVQDIAIRERWPVSKLKPGALLDAVKAAANEALSAGICDTCRGVGEVGKIVYNETTGEPRQTKHACIPCSGTGRARWSDERRAKLCGLDPKWFRTGGWKQRYQTILLLYYRWESEAIEAIVRRQK